MTDSPFIKLLTYKNKEYFVYDVNKNEVKHIAAKTCFDLQGGTNNGMDNKEIAELLSQGYLSHDRPTNIEQGLTRYLEAYAKKRVSGMVLQVTQSCNLKCKYCTYAVNGLYYRTHSSKQMSWDVAKCAIDFLKKHSGDLQNIRIAFYGGEPMLNMYLIRQAVLYAEEIMPYKNIRFAMTSNLTLLSQEALVFLAAHNFKLTISLDGPQKFNDKNRFFAVNGESSYGTVMEKLRMIASYPDYLRRNVQINAVVDKSADPQEILNFFRQHDILKNVPVELSTVDDSNLKIQYYTSPEYLKRRKINAFKSMVARACDVTIEKDVLDDIYERIAKKSAPYSIIKYVHHNGPCIPGVKKLFVNAEGDFFPCEKANEMSEHLKIGNIYSDFDTEKMKAIYNIGKISEEECVDCWAIKLCSTCAVNIDDGTKLSKKLKQSRCVAQKKQLDRELVQLGLIALFRQLPQS